MNKAMDAPILQRFQGFRGFQQGFDPESDNYQGFSGPGFDAPEFEGSYNPSYQSGSYDPTDSESWTSLWSCGLMLATGINPRIGCLML